MSSMLFSLPYEIIWRIIQFLEPIDLSQARQVSKRLRAYCDHPQNWTSISLIISYSDPSIPEALSVWNPKHLQLIIQPHLLFIQTICIWGVRDNIIRYLLKNCHNLQNLTIFGWTTLSDHAFSEQSNRPLCLRSLRLIGKDKKMNFISLDAPAFGNLIGKCPQLEEISIVSCQIQIEIEFLLKLFGYVYVYKGDVSLNTFMVATKRTWSSEDIIKLFRLRCTSNYKYLDSVPGGLGSSVTINLEEDEIMKSDNIVVHTAKHSSYIIDK